MRPVQRCPKGAWLPGQRKSQPTRAPTRPELSEGARGPQDNTGLHQHGSQRMRPELSWVRWMVARVAFRHVLVKGFPWPRRGAPRTAQLTAQLRPELPRGRSCPGGAAQDSSGLIGILGALRPASSWAPAGPVEPNGTRGAPHYPGDAAERPWKPLPQDMPKRNPCNHPSRPSR